MMPGNFDIKHPSPNSRQWVWVDVWGYRYHTNENGCGCWVECRDGEEICLQSPYRWRLSQDRDEAVTMLYLQGYMVRTVEVDS